LLEERKDYDGALEAYGKNDERYNSPGQLLGALRRINAAAPSPRYAGMLDALLKQHLSGGLVKFTAIGSVAAPKAGVVIRDLNEAMSEAGLQVGDVVVAVRGYTIANFKEYILVRNLDENEPYELTIWRGGRYQKLKPLPADYRFGVDIPDYHAP
jgi:S1-C subfamily serine protease